MNETKVVINRNTHRDIITDIAGIGNMSGDNVKISVGNSFINAGGQVQGNKDVNISAGKDINLTSVETVTRKEIGSSRNYTVNEKVQNIESTISGENINLQAGKNLNAIGSDVTAGNNLDIKAGENVNIAASVDSETYEKHKSSSGFFRNKNSTLDTKVTGSNISSGGDVNIFSGKDIKIEARNIEGKNTNHKAENEMKETGRDELHERKIKNEKGEIKITAGVNDGGGKDTEDSDVKMIESSKEIPKAGGVIKDLAREKR